MSKELKIAVAYDVCEKPWGGGNQFLKGLIRELENRQAYVKDFEKADVVIFNSHHNLGLCLKLKNKNSGLIVIHRIDGPISLVRSNDKPIDRIIKVDKIIKLFVDLFADGVIFQSNWCKEKNRILSGIQPWFETVIHNACDNQVFNTAGKKDFNPDKKIKVIAVHWSSDRNKGFDIYRFLDNKLDFSRYEMTFVGNSPLKFKNIKHIEPLDSKKLSLILKQHDIYITASKNDPCSNSLLEALSCGLPAVVLNSGGHPELIKEGGLTFTGEEDVIEKIDEISQKYSLYQKNIPSYDIKNVADEYFKFAEMICNHIKNNKYKPKNPGSSGKTALYRFKLMLLHWKILAQFRILHKSSHKG